MENEITINIDDLKEVIDKAKAINKGLYLYQVNKPQGKEEVADFIYKLGRTDCYISEIIGKSIKLSTLLDKLEEQLREVVIVQGAKGNK